MIVENPIIYTLCHQTKEINLILAKKIKRPFDIYKIIKNPCDETIILLINNCKQLDVTTFYNMIYNNCSEKVILAFINKSTQLDSQLLYNLFSSSNDIIKLEIVKKIFEFSMYEFFHFIKSYKLFDKSSNEEFKKIATNKILASIRSSGEGDLPLLYELFTNDTNDMIKLTIVEKISKLTIHKLLDFFESFKLFEESSNEEYKMIAIANMKKENIIQLFKLFKNPSDEVKIQVINNCEEHQIDTIKELFENPSDKVSTAFFEKFGEYITNNKIPASFFKW